MKLVLMSLLPLLFLAPAAQALEVGDAAPCVMLENVKTNGSSVEHCIREPEMGHELVVLDFFSMTCSDCLASFPLLNQVARQNSNVTFRAVSIDRDESAIRDFIRTRRDLIEHDVALDLYRDARRAYGITVTPTIFVLNAKQEIIFKHQGRVTAPVAAQLTQILQR